MPRARATGRSYSPLIDIDLSKMAQSRYAPQGAATQQDLLDMALWSRAREIWQNIKEVPSTMNIDDYVSYFVPSDKSVPLPACPPVVGSFSNISEGGTDQLMYPPMVSASDPSTLNG
ncbi:hypothetical protein FOMPIDRAFT_1056157 [Fomitopsis schrenkii]|uniref:Uncharacterized protein n=1 Tax=Fomitopsis schrenkii TaxID=2126942 RepID=S8DKF1_FOMSC|nr:hypothetical protein FOMPIDRAFT_1056157 [Fomitopsis schrenkii]